MRVGTLLRVFSLFELLLVSVVVAGVGPAGQPPKQIRLGDCTIYWHSSTETLIAVRGDQYYFGTVRQVVPFVRGPASRMTEHGVMLKCTDASSDGKSGLLLYCVNPSRFYERADDSLWSQLGVGKETLVPVCGPAGGASCRELQLPCGLRLPAASAVKPSPAQPSSPPPAKPKAAAPAQPASKLPPATAPSRQQTSPAQPPAPDRSNFAAAPPVQTIEGEQLKPDEVMVFTRAQLIEQGNAVRLMSEFAQNINTVRYNINTYMVGYSLPAGKVGERFVFQGPVKAWRAPSLQGVSIWPPFTYAASRNEAIRRAKLLQPILLAEPIDEMNNLRVYYYPSQVGYENGQYVIEPTALAFFIDPATGGRMTVLFRGGRAYGAVNGPLGVYTQIYVQEVISYSAGFLGMGRARVPSIFYAQSVAFDVEPFAPGDNLERLMTQVLQAYGKPPLATKVFQALFKEMSRYTAASGQ